MKQNTTSEEILKAFREKDIEGLKAIKERIGLHRWLKKWRDNGSKMEDWLVDEDENEP